jgi:hypothetical protein
VSAKQVARPYGLAGVYRAARKDLEDLSSFPRDEDAVWRILFSPTVVFLAVVIAVLGFLAGLQLFANAVGWVMR